MKRRKAARSKSQHALVEKKSLGSRFIEFPDVKGRTVEKIEMFTTPEYHSITVAFQDKTVLNLAVEPGFTLVASLESLKAGNARTIKRWPAIRSASEGS